MPTSARAPSFASTPVSDRRKLPALIAAIAQLEMLPSQQIRSVREYAVSLPNLTASGGGAKSILENILKSVPKKGLTK